MTQNEETYVAFIDLEKAFDKVWSSAILHLLWKRAIRGNLWRIMHKLNSNQETRVITKFGLTDTIVIEDSIRKGRPLSGTEFGLLIDQLNVELRTTDLVVQYGAISFICLLFMDDIALLARSAKELQEILNITNLFLNKWHLKVKIKKSAVMIFRNSINKTYNNQFQTGTQKLNIQKQCKYLGEHLTENLTPVYHLKEKECHVEGIVQSCIFVSSDVVIANIQMESLFKLYHTVIAPAIVYSCEEEH